MLSFVKLNSTKSKIKNFFSKTRKDDLIANGKQDLEKELDTQVHTLLNEIHSHLNEQDRKIDLIMKKLGVEDNDSRGNLL